MWDILFLYEGALEGGPTLFYTEGVFLSAKVRTDPLVKITGGDKNCCLDGPELDMIFLVIECLNVIAPLVVTPFLKFPYFLVELTKRVM